MIPLLQNNQHLIEKINAGIDIYPSDGELKQFKALAKEIDPDRYFTIYGCQDCVKTLVKFVFDNQNKIKQNEESIIDDAISSNDGKLQKGKPKPAK
jgi:hypothetical protein